MIAVFEDAAKEYDDWFSRHQLAYRSELAAVRSLLPSAGRGLEIGVGTGRFAAPLGVALGVEPAEAMAAIARARGISVIRGYAEALPVAAESCDFVLMVTLVCFLADPFQALGEAIRVLKPGGRLIIGLIDPDSPLGRSYQANQAKSKFYRQARFRPVSQILTRVDRLGYVNHRTCQTIFAPPETLTAPEPVKAGHGQGVFVVLGAAKSAAASQSQLSG